DDRQGRQQTHRLGADPAHRPVDRADRHDHAWHLDGLAAAPRRRLVIVAAPGPGRPAGATFSPPAVPSPLETSPPSGGLFVAGDRATTEAGVATRYPLPCAGPTSGQPAPAASEDVDEHEQAQPHHVDEVPVPGHGLEAEVVVRAEMAG